MNKTLQRALWTSVSISRVPCKRKTQKEFNTVKKDERYAGEYSQQENGGWTCHIWPTSSSDISDYSVANLLPFRAEQNADGL